MATQTSKLGLIMPDYGDFQDVEVLNDNFKKIDDNLMELEAPPMLLGVEYKVNEKFNGKRVYTYTWCAGAVPYADPTTEKTLEVPVAIDRLVRFNAWVERRIDSTSRQFAYSIPYVRGNNSGFTEYVFVTLDRDNNGNWKLHVAHKSTPDNGDYLFCQVWYTKDEEDIYEPPYPGITAPTYNGDVEVE